MAGIPPQLLAMLMSACREGDKLFEGGKIDAAKAKYLSEARRIVGPTLCLPSTPGEGLGGVISTVYTELKNSIKIAILMGCFLGMAKCLAHEKDIEMALAWLEETNALYRCTYFLATDPLYDWIDFNISEPPELRMFRARALCLASELFLGLGNTGTATTRRFAAASTLQPLTPELTTIVNMPLLAKLHQTRHPDPQKVLASEVQSPALQVRGSWKRLNIAKPGGVTEGRENFACFIWNSQFYVAGGRKSSLGPWYRDLWAIDLENLTAWRRLPEYPRGMRQSGMFTGWSMLVHNDTAILFTGGPTVDVLDLVTETWTSFRTTYTPTAADIQAGVKDGWPYPRELCNDATIQIAHNKMYVFGGDHGTTSVVCNLFMELDLTTRKWRRLTGYVRAPQHGDYSCPGPRKSVSGWVSTDKKRIFLLFGQADRQGASLKNEAHGAESAFGYEDMWSWGIAEERWRRERMSGNPPCARTEMACTYNDKLQKTIVFGGYMPTLPTIVLEQGMQFDFSYFADTFVYDTTLKTPTFPNDSPTLAAPKGKQVLTQGFPTYRCQAQLASDPKTGRTYMFGGFTNNQYIPTRSKLFSRSFGDLWELRIDEVGGHFDEVNVEEEMRSAKAGPWQWCFSCAAAGPWRKCGGSCKGRVFLCGEACLKEGWKEHKTMHACKKA
ncbi:hypothetical protein C8F04DRAFT_1107341 [Mycena alexandri]|uniref:Uncharacterized protein n=1 Tax=Mycena alexandri TaxID=1745969 RepID=A0AAD6X1T3_9AGAR|nr:hypothetical protein C8F04DRAFT_1107341 [Mycena alexandri]